MPDIAGLYHRAEEAIERRNYDYARDLFLQILAFEPNHQESRIGLRMACMKKFQEQGAPSRLKVTMLLAKVMAQLQVTKDLKKRIEIAQRYLLDDPNNAKIRTSLAEALLGAGYADGAIIESTMAVENNQNNVRAYKTLGIAYMKKGMIKDAQSALERVNVLAPEDRDVGKLLRDIAATETMKKGFEQATSYRDVIKDKGKAEELEKTSHLIKTVEDIDKQLEKLMADHQNVPSDVKIVKKIGDFYYDVKKDYQSAQEWYKKASDLSQFDSVLRDKVDDCMIKLYEKDIQNAQTSDDTNLQELKVKKIRFEIQSYERRIADRPTDMGLKFELGKRYYMVGMFDRAVSEFQQSVKDPKKKTDSHIYLGSCFHKKKIYDLADTQYQKAEETGVYAQDKLLSILYQRALCNADAGELKNAVDLGKRIMEADINYKDISALVQKWQQLLEVKK